MSALLTESEIHMSQVMYGALPRERKRFLADILTKANSVCELDQRSPAAYYCREVIRAVLRDCRVYPTAEQAMSVADLYHRSERQSRELPRNRLKFN